MSAVLLGVEQPNTEPWYELRRHGIGASEIAGVVGLSRWTSPFQLWHRKKGNLPGQVVTEAMDWGHRLEPIIIAKFAEVHPELTVKPAPGTYANSERSWQRVNPDGLVGDDALLEVKNASAYADDFTKTDIPIEYRCQVQHALDVFGLSRCYVAVLVGGNHYREYVIEADAEDQAHLRAEGAKFWESVQNSTEPPLDCSDHTYNAVRELNPLINKDRMVDLPPEAWGEYLAAKGATKEAEDALTLIKSRILQFMGDARTARFAEMTVLRRQMSSAGTPYLKEVA